MKKLSNLLAALVFGSLVIFMSCGGGGDDPAPSAAEIQAALLTSDQWSVDDTNITFGGTAADGTWTNFKLELSGDANGGTYTTTGTPTDFANVWPTSGEWSFKTGSTTAIIRKGGNAANADNVEVTIIGVSETTLSLSFQVEDPDARINGIYGSKWVFPFTR